MGTYILTREHAGYGEVSIFVIVAPDEETARDMAAEAHAQENRSVWDIAACQKIDTHAHIALRQIKGA